MQTLPKHNKRTANKSIQSQSTEALQQIMDEVMQIVREHDVSDAVVAVNHDVGFSVDVRMGNVDTLSFNEDKSVSVAVYYGHRKGSASSTDTSHESLIAMVKAAAEIAKVSAQDPCFGLPESDLLCLKPQALALHYPWGITPTEAIEQLIACEQQGLKSDSRITNSDGVNLYTANYCHGMANTRGFNAIVQSTQHSVSCSFLAQEGSKMQRDYDYTASRAVDKLLSFEQVVLQAAQRTVKRLGARPLKTQKAPVIFDSRISRSLMSLFISAISGSNLYNDQSFLCGALGKAVFPSFMTIHEQPYRIGALGSACFDQEGVSTRENCFVKQGILQQYALGCYSARRLGLHTTGNAGGVFNLTVEPTTGDLSQLLQQMGTGLLVTELMGNGVDLVTGDYSLGASGFWVHCGEIQYPVEQITIASKLQKMYQGIVAVGSDINPNIATRCGSILIDEMMIAGL